MTTAYDAAINEISVQPVWLCVMTLDACGNEYGTSPCTATYAEKCYKTYFTCRDKNNYSRTTMDYRFSSSDVPVQSTRLSLVRPYLDEVKMFPTEIKDSIASTGETTITFIDEPDTDIGVDPYYTTRTDSTPRSFWRRLLRRNPNYINRPIVLYRGTAGIDEADYEERYRGKIKKISIEENGLVTVTTADEYSIIEDAKTPIETDITLSSDLSISNTTMSIYSAADIYTTNFVDPAASSATSTAIVDAWLCAYIMLHAAGNAQTIGAPSDKGPGRVFSVILSEYSGANTITVNGTTISAGQAKSWLWDGDAWNLSTIDEAHPEGWAGIPSSGYVRIDKEIIYYTAPLYAAKSLNNMLRGQFGTTAAAHDSGASVQLVTYLAPGSAYDHMITLLGLGGIATANIDTAAYTALKAYDIYAPLFEGIISKPTEIVTLYQELVELLDCRSWIGEDLKFTIAKTLPNKPGRTYTTITDANNIHSVSDALDNNEDSRISRVMIYWDKRDPTELEDREENYQRSTLSVYRIGENSKMYGHPPIPKKIFCRWLRSTYMDETLIKRYLANLTARILRNCKNPQPLYSFECAIKDSAIKTGQFVKITSDKVVDETGAPREDAMFQIISREEDGDLIKYTAQMCREMRVGFIAPDATPSYLSASQAEREYGFITDIHGQMSNFDLGYAIA